MPRPSSSLRAVSLAAVSALLGFACRAACPPAGETVASLDRLAAAEWRVDDDARREALALGLADCLAAPDPHLRDDLAETALARWMRAGALQPGTLRALRDPLLATLRRPADADGFAQPFAALTLAEIARVDRLRPFLSLAELDAVVDAGTAYLATLRDHRGFDPATGWRHGVAHGADLLLQLALNVRLDAARLRSLVDAVLAQVAPPGHFYVFGEGDRLAAPVFYVARRDVFDRADWDAWFERVVPLAPPAGPPTLATLAARHDRAQFLLSLHASLRESGTPAMQEKALPGLLAALKRLD